MTTLNTCRCGGFTLSDDLRHPCPVPCCANGRRRRAALAEHRAQTAPGDCKSCCGTGFTPTTWAFGSKFWGLGRGDCPACRGTGFTEEAAAQAWESCEFSLLAAQPVQGTGLEEVDEPRWS